MNNLYIGVMSGTSLDGVDVTLCEINENSCKLLHSHEFVFPKDLKNEVLNAISTSVTLQTLGTLDHKLGQLFADSINEFLKTYKINAKDINAIGLHGQTLWHEPQSETPFSMQLGDANIVASNTQIKTVADFRRMDMANGGQGAPFAPAFHQFLFSNLMGNVAVVNIGGMANITLLGKNLRGWDIGCGNVLLDMWITQTRDKAYDKDGDFARSGRINKELLNAMLQDAYFLKTPPKSTGREYFNDTWVANFLPLFVSIKDEDIQATLLELTARTIADSIKNSSIDTLILCGGGAKNSYLVERLGKLCDTNVKCSDDYGVSSDALESMAFAWLAYKRIQGEVVDLKSVTGASENSQLGAIYG
ncbi:anhydro-N-acetylmuramic acid kinase [Sulfurimonas sp.]|jgi:anhydro-N-acetylmuramic acid kinase|uniref:anhydro-N-acetylmuramic acid kinase n=1 Tax=Sulfurimonas sp. TaxID=2022749 RepID=UPI0025D1B23E|nr:anhydro-N-acetylmuramic acid kinase [Sulfurimonas sp.]MBT5935873.1 anhydro-N-acetylmuramic acid kinase [Sulfurimonas sp.]